MDIRIFDLGLVGFGKAFETQKEIFKDVKNNRLKAALILCRHHAVITLGRLGKKDSLRVSMDELKERGINFFETERGGDLTYHGPGQLTAYPILNLNYFKKDIHFFLRKLEDSVVSFLSDFGVKGLTYSGLTGVWVNPDNHEQIDVEQGIPSKINKHKIASIGIAIKNWVTFHGISINIKKYDLNNFHLIKPCGMDIEMTSLETVLRKDLEIDGIKECFIGNFKDTFSSGNP